MSVDLRTRWDTEVRAIAPEAFFDADFPAALERNADLLESAAHLPLKPLIVDVEGAGWTLHRDDTGVTRVSPGRSAAGDRAGEVRLTAGQLSDLVNDQVTPVGLMTAGTLELKSGRIGRLLDWWLVLRSVWDGRPVHTPGAVAVPADLGKSFTQGDDPARLLAYLESAGYLHLRGVFGADEMARISTEMDAAAPSYLRDDGASWWATLKDGSQRVVRMQRFQERSPAAAALLQDPRMARLAGLSGCGHRPQWAGRNQVEALFKPIGVAHGISDVPWHKDCSLGRHSYNCCSLTVGVSVSGSGPTSGQLRVIAGSHRALVWPSLLDASKLDLPNVALPTETGDVTVHLSCTLHMAQPPTERERRVLYTGFGLPARDAAASAAANARLYTASREGAPRNVTQPVQEN